jgi:hypothetical protein
MPLYLVRWPHLAASLVSARDEDDLVDALDEMANPEGCQWKVYRGPLFIHFELPVQCGIDRPEGAEGPVQTDWLRVDDVAELSRGERLKAEVPVDSDRASEMEGAILRFAFPNVHKLLDAEERESVDPAALRVAVKEDYLLLVRSSWRREHVKRKTDVDSQIAAYMDAPVRLVRYWQAQAERRTSDPRKPAKPPKKPKSKRVPKRPRR